MIKLPPVPQVPPPEPVYTMAKLRADAMELEVPKQVFTRVQAFRLIGYLERLAAKL